MKIFKEYIESVRSDSLEGTIVWISNHWNVAPNKVKNEHDRLTLRERNQCYLEVFEHVRN